MSKDFDISFKLDSISTLKSSRSDLKVIRSLDQDERSERSERNVKTCLATTHMDSTNFITKYSFNLKKLDTDERLLDELLEEMTALELYDDLYGLHHDLANLQLENELIKTYLEQESPKSLIGLDARSLDARSDSMSYAPRASRASTIVSLPSRFSAMTTSEDQSRKKFNELQVNFNAKTKIAEKQILDSEKRIASIEKKSMQELHRLCAKIEDLKSRQAQIVESEKNFRKTFLVDKSDRKFLEKATDEELGKKFMDFIKNWFSCAFAMLSTIRLNINALEDTFQHSHAEMVIKADLSTVLTQADFSLLMNKRREMEKELDDKIQNASGIKRYMGLAIFQVHSVQKAIYALDCDKRRTLSRFEETNRALESVKREVQTVTKCNENDRNELEHMRQVLAKFEAPSIAQYIDEKEKYAVLERKEKLLHRKINIGKMKLNNVYRLYKSQ